MKKEWALATVRLLSAAAMFTFLAQSNEWLVPGTATILVLGYRLGTFLTTPVRRILGAHTGALCFAMAALGSCLWYWGFEWPAVFCLALGLAIGGFLIKEEAAGTSKGAALVAMAMNAGSLIAGALIALAGTSRMVLLGGGTLMLLACAVLMHVTDKAAIVPAPMNKVEVKTSPRPPLTMVDFAWGLLGAATGILVFSIFSVLPQTLLASEEPMASLPSWYGWLVSASAAIIVVMSLPVARFMNALPKSLAFLPLFLGLMTLMLPRFFSVHQFSSALLWVVVISLCETGLSHMDHLAAKARVLLMKEASFGIGASLCVFVSRWGTGANSGYVMGWVGVSLALGGLMTLKVQVLRNSKQRARFGAGLVDLETALL